MPDGTTSAPRKILVQVIAGVLLAVALVVLEWLWGVVGTVLGFAGSGVTAAWRWLASGHTVPGWLLLALVLMTTLLRGAVRTWRSWHGPKKGEYSSDVFEAFGDVRWQWEYGPDGHPHQVKPLCPRDGMELVPCSVRVLGVACLQYHCGHCGYDAGPFPTSDPAAVLLKVIRHVERKLRTGEWREVVASYRAAKKGTARA